MGRHPKNTNSRVRAIVALPGVIVNSTLWRWFVYTTVVLSVSDDILLKFDGWFTEADNPRESQVRWLNPGIHSNASDSKLCDLTLASGVLQLMEAGRTIHRIPIIPASVEVPT